MKLVMTLLVRDEADIIELNVAYHMKYGVDHFIVIDNGSTDGTFEILGNISRNANVTVLSEPLQNFDQSTWMTKAAILARERFGADWIIHNDADEFWRSPSGNLKDQLSNTAAHILHCKRLNMILPLNTLPNKGFSPENFIYHVAAPIDYDVPKNILTDKSPCPYFYRNLPGKVLTRAQNFEVVGQGNHDASYSVEVKREDSDIVIFHYPIRSVGQFQSKIENGGKAYMANHEFSEKVGWHWRRWYNMLQTDGIGAALADALPDEERFARELRDGTLIEDRRMQFALNGMEPDNTRFPKA